jgi:hypothetical protein
MRASSLGRNESNKYLGGFQWNYELVKKLMRHREHFLARDFVSLCYGKGIL